MALLEAHEVLRCISAQHPSAKQQADTNTEPEEGTRVVGVGKSPSDFHG